MQTTREDIAYRKSHHMKKTLMIPRTNPSWQPQSWQEELSQLITDPRHLLELLELDMSLLPLAQKAHKLFPLRCTHSYLQRIEKRNPKDPLLLQILPLGKELEQPEGFVKDPLEEHAFTPAKGLIHKYHGRVLLMASAQCAINCRYCFRRHYDYIDNTPSRLQWQPALDYITKTESIKEVILSGGDPLASADKVLFWLLEQLEQIPHLHRLRIHTRIPLVLPKRINTALTDRLKQSRLQQVLVMHCNHAQELNGEVGQALNQLKQADVTLLNQSVLLKDVNDNTQTLVELSESLFRYGVLPYYLHVLDPVSGAAHFDVKEEDINALHREMLALLPGFLMPKFVREVPHEKSKIAAV